MVDSTRTTQFRFWLWLIRLIGVIVPGRLRADWRQEWEAELSFPIWSVSEHMNAQLIRLRLVPSPCC